MHRLNRMSERAINSVSCPTRGQGPLRRFSPGELKAFKRLAGGPKSACGDNDTLYWRSLDTGRLHGVRAEIVETILNGIDKREASYYTTLYSY